MKRKEEIELFTNSIKLAVDEFYLDSIKSFKKFNLEYPESELVDDSYFNLGLCYFHLNQINESLKYFDVVINEFPDSTISVLNGGNEYGKTPAKCMLSKIHCFLKIGDIKNAEKTLKNLEKYRNSYVVDSSDNKITYFELGEIYLKNYKKSVN